MGVFLSLSLSHRHLWRNCGAYKRCRISEFKQYNACMICPFLQYISVRSYYIADRAQNQTTRRQKKKKWRCLNAGENHTHTWQQTDSRACTHAVPLILIRNPIPLTLVSVKDTHASLLHLSQCACDLQIQPTRFNNCSKIKTEQGITSCIKYSHYCMRW